LATLLKRKGIPLDEVQLTKAILQKGD
jgi:hypothetical protein